MMRVCVGGIVAIAALAVVGAATQAQTGTAPLKLTLACLQGSEMTFRLTFHNVSTTPTAAVIGAVFGTPAKYVAERLRFTLSRAGVADASFDYVDPAVVGLGGRVPWVVTLLAGESHSMVVSIPHHLRERLVAPAVVHASLTTQGKGELFWVSHVWVGTLTSDRIAFPDSCQEPSVSVFETEISPGEGRPHFQAVTNELMIRESPSLGAAIIRLLPVQAGDSVAFDETRFRTMVPGRIQVLSAGTVTGRVIGTERLLTREAYYKRKFPQDTTNLQPGDVIDYLQYRAEGTCFVRLYGRILDATPCPAENTSSFHVVSQPTTEWWIRVVVNGEPLGWLLVEDTTLKLSRRSG